jgi:hypothetical protein
MNIDELYSYNLADAVKFNDQLNPKLWGSDEKMLPQVQRALLDIARDFKEFLGVSDIGLKDITVSGSNAAYTYTPHSDIDLHLVVDLPEADESEVYRELFNAKKFQYNELHNIKIGGYDVELYVQNANQPHVSQGIYSVLNDRWIDVPKRKRAEVDDDSTRSKYEDVAARIDQAVEGGSYDAMAALMDKIKEMRAAGLEKTGEFGPENLAFKMLRTQGYIEKLVQARNAAKDQTLSLDERRKKKQKAKRRVRYGFGGYWYPGTAYAGQDHPAGELGGGDGGGGESVHESVDSQPDYRQYFNDIVQELGIEQPPELIVHTDDAWSHSAGSFGQYDIENNVLHLSADGRHVLDIIRTMAHELTHCRQGELQEFPNDAGETGSPFEDEANAMAGRIMRGFAERYPDLFKESALSEATGYIPTEREKNDPRFSMALTADVRPGAVGKNANKLGLKTNAQGEPSLLMKGLKNALREFKETGKFIAESVNSEDLFEVNMSPTNLRALAQAIDARAGMEFEVIVPGVADDDGEIEADYSVDERATNINHILGFFSDDGYNSRSTIRDLERNLREEYHEWQWEKIGDAWDQYGREFFNSYYRENYLDDDEVLDEAEEYVREQYPDVDSNSSEFKQLVQERGKEIINETIEEEFENQGRAYNDAYDEFRDIKSGDYDEEDWLISQGYHYMSNIEGYSDVTWPYYTSASDDGDIDVNSIANEFSKVIGRPVNASSSYHGARRKAGHYVVEPDSSLESDDGNGGGLEFVSPPLPLGEMLDDLRKFKEWAGRQGIYTNKSTGLHMNVSVPGFSNERLDYVKLAVLLGDEYILRQFDRLNNTYTKSAMSKVKDLVVKNPDRAAAVLDKMKSHLDTAASQMLHGTKTDKYTSINVKDGYVEFRSPGGDWLSEDLDKLESTLLRFVVALDAAIDENKYREEYQKKLYRLLAPKGQGKDTTEYFSKYVAGEMPKAALKSFIKQAQLERSIKRQTAPTGEKYWWLVAKEGLNADNGSQVEVVAATEQEALNKAAREWGHESAATLPKIQARVISRYHQEPKKAENAGNYGVWITSSERFARVPGEYSRESDIPLRRFPSRDAAEFYLDQLRSQNPGMRTDIEVREIPADYQPGAPAGQPVAARTTAPEPAFGSNTAAASDSPGNWFQGNWGIWIDTLRKFAREPGTDTVHRFPSREAVLQYSSAARNPGSGVEAREIPDDYESNFGSHLTPRSAPATTGNFTGYWLIKDGQGRVLHRFGGVGNAQSDANRVAMTWLTSHPRYMQDGVEVVPEMQ